MSVNKAAKISLFINIFLFLIKAFAGFISNSIAVISDAVNSLTDIISSTAIIYSVKVSQKQPDEDHQFGHNAAQPLAVFLIAMFTALVGFGLIKESIDRISAPHKTNIDLIVFIILGITIIIKIILSRYQLSVGKKFKSPAIRASSIDSLSDVLATSVSLVGIIFVQIGLKYFDGIAGIIVALIIIRTGYLLTKENIDYLMGRSADRKVILDIANAAMKIKGVKGFNDIRSYYVGNKFHVEIHIEVDKNMSTEMSHNVGKDVENAILNLEDIQKVFVHIDPV
ncbi:MAG TPA: cation transporter [Ignavibacteria bacterium]|nr:cation transporter [Ignavibacteria bacterium]